MICPIKCAGVIAQDYIKIDDAPCEKEGCAWYDKDRRQCAILTMAVALSNINGGLAK